MSQLSVNQENADLVTQSTYPAGTANLAANGWAVPRSLSRRVVEFYNNGAVNIFISTSNVAATALATGRPIAPGQSWSDSSTCVAWFVFAASGTADVRITLGDDAGL